MMNFNPAQAKNLVELLVQRASAHPERIVLHCLDDTAAAGGFSFAELDRRARAVAVGLRPVTESGDRALILLHSGIDYVSAFFGCLYAGVIAVPAYPPESMAAQHVRRVASILADAAPAVILTASHLIESITRALDSMPGIRRPKIVAVDAMDPQLAVDWTMPAIAEDGIAFLQYTSGSTASPKGVMVGHDNLMANERAIKQGFAIGDDDVFVSWLPLYHDMGLVGGLLQPVYSGIPLALMSPRHFLERPVRWLEAVSRFGGTISGGPDFAFRLCNERITDAQLQDVRLDSWRLAFCGAEPIRHATLTTFAGKFSAAGLPPTALYPCYGLAEATLLVTGGRPGEPAAANHYSAEALAENRAQVAAQGVTLVDCGLAQAGHELAIIDPETGATASAGRVGEIRLSGPSVTHGYWRNSEATANSFINDQGKTWLRTGDLGFVDNGRLFITGRSKDLILIRGQNIYPQDIEQALEEQVELLRKGRIAAFAVTLDGHEGIGIAAEIGRSIQKLVPAENLFNAINEAVALSCQEPAAVIILLNPGALPKTSSGKLQRSACRQGWLDGSLDSYAIQQGGVSAQAVAAQALTAGESKIAAIWCEVLGIAHVAPEQSFFAAGGQSITAVQTIARIRDAFGVAAEPALFFEAPTLREFAAAIERLAADGVPDAGQTIPAHTETEHLPLSYGQESLWFLAQLDPSSAAYHIAGGVRIACALDRAALQSAFDALAERHDALRTVFYAEDGQPWQRLLPPSPVAVDVHDLSHLPADASAAEAARLAEAAARQPFDLERGPLWRVTLVRLPSAGGEPVHELSLCLHHLIADGWSLNRLLAEFAEGYAAAVERRMARLPALPIRHADYALWQRRWLEAGESERQLAYWSGRLGDEHPVIELPYDRPRPAEPSQRGGRVPFALPAAHGQALRQLAQRQGVTPFTVLLAAFNVLLYRYSGQNDLRIGLPLANRNRPETQGLIGYFVNTVVLRSEIDGGDSFTELLARTRQNLLQAQAHPDLPFEHLVDALQPERTLGQNPLFQILINHQQRDFSTLQARPDWRIEALERDNGAAQFDLSLDTEQDAEGRISGFFTYARDLFDAATIERLAGHYQQLLQHLVSQPELLIAAQPLLGDDELARFAAWNVWKTTYDAATPVHELIRRQAERQPDAVALIRAGERLRYGELEARANRLAQRLIGQGVGAESRVALLLPRGLDALIAMLAVLKAGGAFLPLDPDQPGERRAALLAEAGVSLVLASQPVATDRPVLDLSREDLAQQPATPPAAAVHPEQLAYLIYTSGSTGRPKSVAVSHGALAKHCLAIAERYGMRQDDTALHFAAFTFDAAMEQWLVPLITGCRLLIRDELWSADQAYHTLVAQGVTWFEMPPAYLTEIARWAEQQGKTLPLRSCSVGGEAVPRDSLAQIRRVVGDAPIVNGYGPTETLITPLVWTAQADTSCDSAYAPIGTGVGERALYVLDADLNLLPQGAIGELYLGGPCLARGYHGRPGLTAERFLPDPFGSGGGRLYRTGDLVRFRADGTVDYIGRGDHQIKLRGFRIELGEIEAQALSHPAIGEAVALAHGEGDGKRLLLYAAVAGDIGAEAVKTYLQQRLPDYMVPAQILLLDKLPRLSSGKLNRHALPSPEWSAAEDYRAPKSPVERDLAAIWQAVLCVAAVGVNDNFFELGGDSIMAIRVVSRARQAGWLLSPRDLFLHQTVAGLAGAAQRHVQSGSGAAPASGIAPLTPIQAQFFSEDIPRRGHWNLSLLLQSRQTLDVDRLEQSLRALLAHHDSLRLRYRLDHGAWRQYYAEPDAGITQDVLWSRAAEDQAGVEAIARQAQGSLDLEHGPLLRAVHIRVGDGSERLLLVVHHLVVDGVSWRILLEDLQTLYSQNAPLPARTASFRQWSERLRDYAGSESLRLQLPYWLDALEAESCDVPRDYPQDTGRFGDARTLSLRFSADHTRQLLAQAPAAYRTRVNDLLLTALARVLCRWSGRNAVTVELEGHGREDLFDNIDLSRSVGWFTSLYPVRLPAESEPGAAIKAVKETLRGVPDSGLGFGVLKHLAADGMRERFRTLPQPRVSFNYFGQLDAEALLFQIAPESPGDDHDAAAPLASWLEINARVLGGELELRWRFSDKQYRAETVQLLLDGYRDELLGLLGHCLSGAHGATPSDFPLAGLAQAQIDALPVAIEAVEDIYPLSPMQQGILFHALLEPETGVYVNQMGLDIDGLDIERFAAAWRQAVDRHPVLRSAFIWRGEADHPLQVVYKQAALPLEILDWRDRAPDGAQLAALRAEAHARGFDPARAPLMRLLLVRLPGGRFHLVWTSHHILLDGWSTSQLLGEVLANYAGTGRPIGGGHYRDYIAWLQRQDRAASEAFWRQRLAALDEPTRLADALRIEAGEGYGMYRCRLDTETTRRLQDFAQRQRVTLNTLLQAAWALLLQRYCGQDTVAFGATVSGRPADLAGVERIIGLFINTLPLIVGLTPEQRVGDWLRALQEDNLVLREHEQTPLYDIQRWAGQPGAALFDSLLVFENFPVDEALRNAAGGLRFGLPTHIDTTHYPLTLNVGIGETLRLAYGYWRDRFDAGAVETLDRHFRQLLTGMTDAADRPIGTLSLQGGPKAAQLSAWNATDRRYPSGLIPDLISQCAARQPDTAALLFGEAAMTYAELERRANRLAHYLAGLGVGPDVPVGIAVERSFSLVIGLLAIVKAGGAYVPLDPDYPAERLAYMIGDSGIGLLLSHAPVRPKLDAVGAACQCLDLDRLDLSAQPEFAPRPRLHPESPAYIIYTSGSSGLPKGAANSHAALANRLHWMQEAYPLAGGDTVLQKTPFSFDVSVWEFFWPLMTGARLAIAEPGAHRDPARLAALMARHRVTTLHFVPSMLAEFVNQPELPALTGLKRIICSGEALPAELLQRVFRRLPGVELDNLYGPTEAAIDVTHWTCRDDGGAGVPIGEPIANTRIHILDADLNPLPAGVAGELYIAGRGLARGYHRRPGLTAERFLPDPFGRGGRLYRTGDRARRRADGVIDYLGRLDQQVKLRGLRIELGEIEAALLAQPGIDEAAVVLKDGPLGPQLVAYAATAGRAVAVEDLKAGLRRTLPEYMVPGAIMLLDSLPKTANGKLDRRALPDAQLPRPSYRPPQSDRECRLAALWQELLGLERVGLDDNFFELGGHSLLVMKLAGRIRQSAGVELPVRRIFETARLDVMAAEIDGLQRAASDTADVQRELADALAQLQGLSADELQALLAGEADGK